MIQKQKYLKKYYFIHLKKKIDVRGNGRNERFVINMLG